MQRAQRLGLLQPALEALTQPAIQQQATGLTSFTPQRANVLLRPLAASTAEQAAQDAATESTAVPAALDDAAKAAAQPTPATAVLPTPLLMTPAGASLLQTPASNAAWAAMRGPGDAAATLGLTPAVALAGAGVRPVAAFPHFLQGMMAGTPLMQPGRPMRPGEMPQGAELDDGKLSKKRQGYHIEPAALQKLIEKQQLEAQRKHEQEMQATVASNAHISQAAAEAEAAAAAAAAAATAGPEDNPDEPPPRQQQQQQPRARVLSRLPPQVREQAERQAAERARKAAEQQEQEEAEAAAEAAADTSGSSRQHSAVGSGAFQQQQQQPMTAADCLESPNGTLGGLRLPVGPDLDPQGQGLDMDLESGKLFGSAQKRLRLSLCDENGSLLPGGQPLISPVVLPTPSPAVAVDSAPAPGPAGGGAGSGAAGSSSAAAAPAVAVQSQEAPTPSKFFSGSPVPQTERRALGHRAPETPVALVTGAPPARKPDVQEALLDPIRGGAQGADGAAGQGEGGSGGGWVPVPGQAPAVPGAKPAPPPPPASTGGDADDMQLDPAAAAAMPVPESPVKQVTAVGAGQQAGGGGESMVLQTPEGQDQVVAATPVTGL